MRGASITSMIRHYVALRAQVTGGNLGQGLRHRFPRNRDCGRGEPGVLGREHRRTWIQIIPVQGLGAHLGE